MTAETKLAHNRMTLLQLAQKLQNVSEACRRRGVSRSQFYEYKRAYQERGFEGLMDLPPIPKRFPNQIPEEVRKKVIETSLEHPAWGPVRISDHLRLADIFVSPSSIRNLLIKQGMRTRYERLLRLEEERYGKELELTEEQVRMLERANPCFRERKVESPYPGFLLCQDTFFVGTLKGIGRVYLQAVVDAYGSFAFGKLYTSKAPETAVDILYDRVLPFYKSHDLRVEHILTDNGTEYCGRAMVHHYQIFLDFNDIKHRRTKVARPRTNGFVERFNRTVLDEFFRVTFRNKLYASLEELQNDLDQWLDYYNYQRPHRGYRNMGRRPIETIKQGKLVKEQQLKQAA
jgi:transposase InsO family protein